MKGGIIGGKAYFVSISVLDAGMTRSPMNRQVGRDSVEPKYPFAMSPIRKPNAGRPTTSKPAGSPATRLQSDVDLEDGSGFDGVSPYRVGSWHQCAILDSWRLTMNLALNLNPLSMSRLRVRLGLRARPRGALREVHGEGEEKPPHLTVSSTTTKLRLVSKETEMRLRRRA